jgi:CRISPR-associated endonuclease/helicase Cas3
MLPSGLLEPILDALNAYHSIFNVSILLSTASQPAIVGKIGGKDNGFIGLENVKEIVPDAPTLFQKLKRTDISIRDKSQTYQEIADELMSCEKVLCIVNTRSEALEIYKKMSEDKNTIHLSRMMCSAHIMEMISTIKLRLKNRSDEPLRVISTQLIEAGVDIDFPVVYRSIAGLDSIIQAAGRCNREGKLNGLGKVIVFRGEKNTPPGLITKGKNSMEELLHVNGDLDIFDPRTMTAYFNLLFSLHINSFDKADIKHKLYNPPYFLFKDAAEDFKMIDDSSFPIVVYYGDGCTYIEELKDKGANRFLLRKLQNYSVSVREKDFKELAKSGRIEEFDGIWVQSDPDLYHQDIGICMENKWLEETYIL